MRPDAVVVGAGPAGIATAIAASLKGLRVTVLDHRRPPIDKPCGEGLLPEAVRALSSLGVDVSVDAHRFCGIRFSDEQSSVGARIWQPAYGLRRTLLHERLVQRATDLGVQFMWGVRVQEFGSNNVIADGRSISFRWLVGADGQKSIVRKSAGLSAAQRAHRRFGFRRHYAIPPWSDFVEVYWGKRCQVFVTPTGAEEICVASLTDDSRMRIEHAFEQLPELEARVRGGRAIATEAGAVSTLARAHAVARGNVALVGDASCAIDGIAGQGLSLAFRQAVALGEALAGNDLAGYAAAHREITSNALRMTRLLLMMASSVTLRRKVLRFFAANPEYFARIMAIHTHEAGTETLRPGDLVGLGWRILWV